MAGGSLKLKGDVPKKKKKSTTQQRLREEETNASKSGGERAESVEGEGNGRVSAAGSRSESPVVPSGKTGAQMRFEEVQKARLLEKAAKAATKTHKERVAEFNEKLENLSEHHDIPRVGPG